MSFPRLVVALLAAVLCWAGAARAGERAVTLAGLAVTLWEPDGAAPAPIVIFSHGFHGCATQSRFLMRALADAGYLVAAPNHRDATCGADPAGWFDRPEQRFGRPVDWTEATFRDRADDLRALIAALRADPVLRGRIDWRRLALAGHSLGGYTVLGLAGAWPTWRIDGVQAVLALSPYTQPLVLQHRLGSLTAAVMYQGGTFDFGLTPALRGAGGAFDQTPPPKYFVEFAGAAHLAWADIGRRAHPEIVAYSLAFLDHYVRGAPAAALLTHAVPGVARLRFASDLGSGEQVAGSR